MLQFEFERHLKGILTGMTFVLGMLSTERVLAGAHCDDIKASFDDMPSTGAVRVPTTIDTDSPFKNSDAMVEINRNFKYSQIERIIFDRNIDLQSKARLLGEFRCFQSWKQQHDFYRRVVTDSECAHLRHKALQLLEYDMCNANTVSVFIDEYSKSKFTETRELIIKKLGVSKDKRAAAIIDEAIKGKFKSLSRSAAEGKSYGENNPCGHQSAVAKPNYGSVEIAEVCESQAPELEGNSAGPDMSERAKSEPTLDRGGVESVDFNLK